MTPRKNDDCGGRAGGGASSDGPYFSSMFAAAAAADGQMDGCRNSLNCEFAEQPNDAEMKAISFELNGAARQADRQKGVGGQLSNTEMRFILCRTC